MQGKILEANISKMRRVESAKQTSRGKAGGSAKPISEEKAGETKEASF